MVLSIEWSFGVTDSQSWKSINPVNPGSDNIWQRTNNLHRPQADGDGEEVVVCAAGADMWVAFRS